MSTEKTHTAGPTLTVSPRDLGAPDNAPNVHCVDVIHSVAPNHPVYASAYGATKEEARARAHQLAAAPELLAFAQKWVAFRNGTEDVDPKELWAMATIALARLGVK